MKTALVIGASGLVGSECLQQLLHDKFYDRVIALSRKPLGVEHVKLLNQIVNFDDPQSFADYCGVDVVFSAIGTTIKKAGSQEAFYKVDFSYAYEVAKAAKAAGAQTHVLISAVGADAESLIFYPKTKGELEKAITELGFEHNIILRPSLLLGDREEERLGEKIGQKLNTVLKFVAPSYQGVEAAQVAKAMIKLAKASTSSAVKSTQIIENKTIIELANG